MDSWVLISILEEDRWHFAEARGIHHQYKHPTKSGKVTVPYPKKDFPKKTVQSVLKLIRSKRTIPLPRKLAHPHRPVLGAGAGGGEAEVDGVGGFVGTAAGLAFATHEADEFTG